MRATVSLVMVALNAEATIGRAIGSVRGLVDEIVVAVDSRTTDATSDVAAGLGATVAGFDWPDSFAEARNTAQARAAGEWALWLDADEWVPAGEQDRLRRLLGRLRGAGPACYQFGQFSRHHRWPGMAWEVPAVRLFPRGLRWIGRVHEEIDPAGLPVRPSGIRIDHDGYDPADVAEAKLRRNLALLELDAADHPGDGRVADYIARTRAELECERASV